MIDTNESALVNAAEARLREAIRILELGMRDKPSLYMSEGLAEVHGALTILKIADGSIKDKSQEEAIRELSRGNRSALLNGAFFKIEFKDVEDSFAQRLLVLKLRINDGRRR